MWTVQWDEDPKGGRCQFEVTSEMSGEGVWGIAIQYQEDGGTWKYEPKFSSLSGESTCRSAMTIPKSAKMTYFAYTFNGDLWRTSNVSLVIKDVKIDCRYASEKM